MKSNKTPGSDDTTIKFYEELLCNKELEERFHDTGKYLKIVFNYI